MSFIAKPSANYFLRGSGLAVCLGTVVFLGIAIGYQAIGFSVLRSDVADYVNWSHNLAARSYPSHMPGYPALIALTRLLTFNLIGDAALAQGICLLFWGAGVFLTSQILQSLAPETKEVGTLIYALAPFVGVSSAAYPLADIPAHAFFLGAVYSAVKTRWWAFALVTALGLMIHQAFYPFYLLLALVCLFSRGMKWTCLVASGVPFAIYYVWMAALRGNVNWILAYHEKTHLAPRKGFVLFDGILGNLLRLTPIATIKGLILLLILLCAVFLAIHFLKRKNWLLLSMLLPLLMYSAASNETICFLLVRLSKIMVFPACVLAVEHPAILRSLRRRSGYWLLASCLVITQFIWAAYQVAYLSRARPRREKPCGAGLGST